MMRIVGTFVGVMMTHAAVQFIVWALVDGGRGGLAARVLWRIVSMPLLPALGSLSDVYFWPIAITNSVVWAGVFTILVYRIPR